MNLLRLTGIALLISGLAGCNLFRQPAPKADPPKREGGVTTVRITQPTVSREGPILRISSELGLVATLDMRELVDPDNDFKPIGDDPEMDWIAEILMIAIRDLFQAGFYDKEAHHLTQAQINSVLRAIKIARPIKLLKPGPDPEDFVVGLYVFEQDKAIAMTILVKENHGFAVGTVHPARSQRLPRLSDQQAAFTKKAAYRAIQRFDPGFAAQSLGPGGLVRTKLHLKGDRGGTKVFYWVPRGPNPQFAVKNDGTVLRLDSGFSFQSVQRRSIPVTRIGRIEGDPADFAGLRK